MPDESQEEFVPELRFKPWQGGDPVPAWVKTHLDRSQLIALDKTGLEFYKALLQAQLKANAQALEIISALKT